MNAVKKNLPFTGEEGLHELKKIAERFEEKVYVAATSQSDYLGKLSLKMFTMETMSQNTVLKYSSSYPVICTSSSTTPDPE
ncbi:Coactivator CBP, KIX domain containing protein [Parasponia andersonii]|uniref:Coactivator CBP, KIX domain containing protein n=1 Tax=Parasponia andersonii TaxID=3476 RepID=A0A2P5AZ41_PARAD|nr:Coactivator CBP, KIX domain containing protein [Parasponia andersonii]